MEAPAGERAVGWAGGLVGPAEGLSGWAGGRGRVCPGSSISMGAAGGGGEEEARGGAAGRRWRWAPERGGGGTPQMFWSRGSGSLS